MIGTCAYSIKCYLVFAVCESSHICRTVFGCVTEHTPNTRCIYTSSSSGRDIVRDYYYMHAWFGAIHVLYWMTSSTISKPHPSIRRVGTWHAVRAKCKTTQVDKKKTQNKNQLRGKWVERENIWREPSINWGSA